MRILYGAGNFSGSNIRLGRFLKHCSRRQHDVRVAAYLRNHQYLDCIDWTLDAVRTKKPNPKARVADLFGGYDGEFPRVHLDRFSEMLAELTEWDPQLVISDAEPVTAHIAKAFCTRLWSCSPLHLLDGVEWDIGHINRSAVIKRARRQLASLPSSARKLVYSPFADLSMRPLLKDGYEWVTPYTNPNDDGCLGERVEQNGFRFILQALHCGAWKPAVLTTGETSFVADAFYQGKIIAVSPHSWDAETVLNAILCEYFGVGRNLGEIGKDISYSNNQLRLFQNSQFNTDYLSKQKWGKLHEKVRDICTG